MISYSNEGLKLHDNERSLLEDLAYYHTVLVSSEVAATGFHKGINMSREALIGYLRGVNASLYRIKSTKDGSIRATEWQRELTRL